MIEFGHNIPFLIFLVGALISLSLWIKAISHKRNVPALVGFVLLGWALRTADNTWSFLPETAPTILHFLSEIGIIILLFRIGYQSHIKALIAQLSRASFLAIFNILLSGILGFFVSHNLLSIPLISSLFISVALTATSIGVTVSIWKEHKILNTHEGDLLLDLVALDDVIAIVLMGILFSLAPFLHEKATMVTMPLIAVHLLIVVGKFSLFILLCYLFAHYIEPNLTKYLKRYEPNPDPMITIAGVGFMIASVAAFFGFSVALGAFLAGIAFSRAPEVVEMESSFKPLEDFFIPFFFIGIGFKLSFISFSMVLGYSLVLLICAILAKVLGVYLPARLFRINRFNALILGVSMIPRAEIAMITMDHGQRLGSWAVSQDIYSIMVFISLITSISAPLILHPILKKRLAKP